MKKYHRVPQLLNTYIPPIVWAGLIFFLSDQSTLPGASYPLIDLILKQSAHVFVYAVLYFLIWRINKKSIIAPLLLTFTYALTDEFHQSFIPGRTATIIDIGFDSIGIAISHYLTHRQKRLHSHKPQNR
ncbi:MAG: VanZ family protein [Candidatus Pacebacteria bacterium]|jgi:VanZ family protein|nr:VanZ family protein [Candidatus Paceibacterota bacterium]MBT3512348.1 VanZ family protein [Candidatus Paceibacterota bacterium]MBT4005027.1 VanZ family protein [Candidatus Paceibacterota bacterium]MBT4358803.1 VanZ family protein [Candidatus Paceibacterota bacterium]MBT6898500.1 VanZ family protein [Candidatus Paceibacterota bacterium]